MNTQRVSFDWSWHVHLDVWAFFIAILVGYFVALRWWGPRRTGAGEVVATRKQKLLFTAGVGVLWVAAEWPIHDLAENYLFSIHMVQHTLFTLVAPPLILAGMPPWLLRAVIPGPALRVLRMLTRPVVAFIIFNTMVIVTHWPPVVDGVVPSEPLHFGIHVALVGAALLMWWPVVDPLPELSRLSEPAKMLYLFLQSILPTVPASFITFASTPMYDVYARFPRLWGISVVTDQRIAGLIMKLLGGLLLWVAITYLFFRWHAREEADEVDELTWEDFERELQAWELRK